MNYKKLCLSVIFLTVSMLAAQTARADDAVPAWMQDAAKYPVPAYDVKDVPAVVLFHEEATSIGNDGTILTTERYAVKILIREGRDEARARAVYLSEGEKVRDIKAWLIRAAGQPKYYGKKEIIDAALAENDLYNESRIKFIDGSGDANTGDIFGYETVVERKTVFSQSDFYFQTDIPVIVARYNLTLPEGWKAESITFNREKVTPQVSGTNYLWELRNLAPIPPESSSPARTSLAPRLAVSYFPSANAGTPLKTFGNWNDVAKWMSELEDPQMTIDDALAVKARELTANAKTEFEKIQAISRYVQQIQYISVQIGLGKGGGYRPHSATEVFAKSYGDCKDKANLMRAMLSVVKIQSYMVSITADDATYVRPEWSSPHQFNHAIVAVKVSDETKAPTVVTHPKLGRLLIFDATDPYTQLGDLPSDEQGSYALIDSSSTDELLLMPILPAEMSRVERNINVTLSSDGSILGSVNEKSLGQSASSERAALRRLSSADYNQMIENWISRGASGAKTTKISPNDGAGNGNFDLNVEFGAKNYAQMMQNHLMVFKPAIISRLERLSFSEGKRNHPFVIDPSTYLETVQFKLPAGFAVDEVPDAVNVETPFGKYSATYEVKDDTLIFSRSLKLNKSTVPADKYDTVKSFFSRVHSAEQSPVVLVKK